MRRGYAKGKKAWGLCQRSGKRVLLNELVEDGQVPNLLVAPEWYEPKHPQERLLDAGDSSALYRPSPENENEPVTFRFPAVDGESFEVINNPFFGFGLSNPGPSLVLSPLVTHLGSRIEVWQDNPSGGTVNMTLFSGGPPIAGDVVVLCVAASALTASFNISVPTPAGWELFIPAYGDTNDSSGMSQSFARNHTIFYRVMTGTDPPATIALADVSQATRDIYVYASLWRNVDPVQPLDFFVLKGMTVGDVGLGTSKGFVFPPVRMHSATRTGVIFGAVMTDAGDVDRVTAVNVPGTPLDLVNIHQAGTTGPNDTIHYFGSRYATATEIDNLFGDRDDYTQPQKGWTALNLTGPTLDETTSGYGWRHVANTTNGRHHLSKTVTLTAGQRYAFSVGVDHSLGTGKRLFTSVVFPDTSEIGSFYKNNSTNTEFPLSTWFSAGFLNEWSCEVSTGDDRVHGKTFVAPVTGSYEFRVGILVESTGLTYAGSGGSGDEFFMHHACLRKGPYPLPFTDLASAAENVGWRNWTLPVTFETSGMPNMTESGFWGLSLVPKYGTIKPMELVNLTYGPDDYRVGRYPLTTTSRLVGGKKQTTTAQGGSIGWHSDGIVPPKISGVAQKYYFEVTINTFVGSAGQSQNMIGVSPVFGSCVDSYTLTNAYSDGGSYAMRTDKDIVTNGVQSFTANSTVLSGDVVGVLLDLVSLRVSFTINGVAVNGGSPNDGGGISTAKFHDLQHWRASVVGWGASIGVDGAYVTANFAGPFLYKPLGFRAFDWRNEVL